MKGTNMRHSLNDPADPPLRRFVVIGNPGSRRVELFDAALRRQGDRRSVLIPWIDWIEDRCRLAATLQPGDIVRLESPGKDFAVERAILTTGAAAAESEGCERLNREQLVGLDFDKGRILCPRQWYLGFARLLDRLKHELAARTDLVLMSDPGEIAMMFDKPSCHAAMAAAGLPVPTSLGRILSYNELVARMTASNIRRVFVKLANGSSGSGVVAYRTDGRRHLAWTTVETAPDAAGVRLYNTRKLRRLTDRAEIARVIDLLCPHGVHVERWIPKAGMEEMAFDLRVVMIAAAPAHVVARLSESPVTNLHLLNQRRSSEIVRARVGETAWGQAMRTCTAAMRLFPRSLYAGIDLLFTPDLKRHAILEINAFGDLLPGVLHDGLETYDAEIRATALASPVGSVTA
jgi:hypothetical protein